MTAFRLKTASEQRLEYLQSLNRRLTNDEWEQVRRCEHAIYVRSKRLEAA